MDGTQQLSDDMDGSLGSWSPSVEFEVASSHVRKFPSPNGHKRARVERVECPGSAAVNHALQPSNALNATIVVNTNKEGPPIFNTEKLTKKEQYDFFRRQYAVAPGSAVPVTIPRTKAGYETVTKELEEMLGVLSGSADHAKLSRADINKAMLQHKRRGFALPSGPKGTSAEDDAAFLVYARFLKCTVRDAVKANAEEWSEFLGAVRNGLKVGEKSKGFPPHQAITDFLAGPPANLPQEDIHSAGSPFHADAYEKFTNEMTRSHIVANVIRTGW
jgi:hypothetical protein